MTGNTLYYGDNLTIMQDLPLSCVDLIYLDPPFNSKRNYNLMYRSLTGKPVPESVEAFCDTWEMDPEKEQIARKMPVLMREHGVEDYYVEFWRLWMQALRYTQPHLLAYLIYMVERLLQMKSILKSTGSIYLHCDPTTSHYIKVMMDGIFGHRNFKNEIIWSYRRWPSKSHHYQTMHDTILFYTMGGKHTFNVDYESASESYLKRFKGKTQVLDPVTKTRKLTIDKPTKGMPQRDVWNISIIAGSAKERLGYPTQKPLKLLNRIIRASSNPGDVVFDPFCGCGTTIYAAETLKRKWVGCDIAILAVRLVADTLYSRYQLEDGEHYEITGVPVSSEQALDLFRRDPFQFEHWAVERVGGFPNQKQVADKGIDGRIYFETLDGMRSMVLSVKGGHVRPTDVRDLIGVLGHDEAVMAGFISNREPTNGMRQAAAGAGMFEYGNESYPRVQFLTINDLFEGRELRTPTKVKAKVKSAQAKFRW